MPIMAEHLSLGGTTKMCYFSVTLQNDLLPILVCISSMLVHVKIISKQAGRMGLFYELTGITYDRAIFADN